MSTLDKLHYIDQEIIKEISYNSIFNSLSITLPVLIYSFSFHDLGVCCGALQTTTLGILFSYQGCTIYPFAAALTQAIYISSSQLFGAEQMRTSFYFYQLSLVFQIILVAILSLVLIVMCSWVFTTLGYEPDFVISISNALPYYLISQFINTFYSTLQSLLIAYQVFYPFPYINAISSFLFWYISWYFTSSLGLGLQGVLYAFIIHSSSNVIMLYSFVLIKKPLPKEVEFELPLKNLGFLKWEYIKCLVKYSESIFFLTLSDNIIFQFLTILSGQFGPVQLFGHIALNSITMYIYIIGLGIGQTISTYFGRALGQKNQQKFMDIFYTAAIIMVLVCISYTSLMLIFRDYILSYFVQIPESLQIANQLFLFVVLIVNPIDFFQIFFATVLAALEQREFIRKIIPYSFYFIGAPSMVILSFYFKLDILGLWIGIFLAYLNIVVQSVLKIKEMKIKGIFKLVDDKIDHQQKLFENYLDSNSVQPPLLINKSQNSKEKNIHNKNNDHNDSSDDIQLIENQSPKKNQKKTQIGFEE